MNITNLQCTQQNNTLLINNKSGILTVAPGDVLIASVRATDANLDACAGLSNPTWGIIAKAGSPLGSSDAAVSNLNNRFDSNGCGATAFTLNIEGTYSLICRWCCSWSPYDPYTCSIYNTDLPNIITVRVSSSPQPGTSGCDPITCSPTKNFCVLGACIPKTFVFVGAIAGFIMMTMKE